MVVFMGQLQENAAPMSAGVPILAEVYYFIVNLITYQVCQYYAAAMFLVTLSNVATVMCLRLHYENSATLSEMNGCVSLLVFMFYTTYSVRHSSPLSCSATYWCTRSIITCSSKIPTPL